MKKLLFYKELCDSVLKMRAFEVVLVKQSREKQNQKKIPVQSRKKMESKKVIIRPFSPHIPTSCGLGQPAEAAGETAAFRKYFQAAAAQVKIISERVHKHVDKGG